MTNDEQIHREEIAGEILTDYVSNYLVKQDIWKCVNYLWQTYEKEGVILTLSIIPGVTLNYDKYDCLEKLRDDLLKEYGRALHVIEQRYGYCKNIKDQKILGVISLKIDINDDKLKTEINKKIDASRKERLQVERQWIQNNKRERSFEKVLEQLQTTVNSFSS